MVYARVSKTRGCNDLESSSLSLGTMSRFSRRDFLKLGGAGLASLAFSKYISPESPPPPVELHYRCYNLNLNVVLTEHNQEAADANFETIKPILDRHNLIIPEYFPPDYQPHLDNDPILGPIIKSRYNGLNTLFDYIERYLKPRSGTEIRVVDPAYSSAAAWVRFRDNSPFLATTLAIDAKIAKNFYDRTTGKTTLSKSEIIDRSTQEIFAGLLSTITGGYITFDDKWGTENDMRRVLIATALCQLGKTSRPGSTAAIIYPEAHWNGQKFDNPTSEFIGNQHHQELGIFDYLENDTLREERFSEYSRLRKSRLFAPLFNTRHYVSKNNSWETLSAFEIN